MKSVAYNAALSIALYALGGFLLLHHGVDTSIVAALAVIAGHVTLGEITQGLHRELNTTRQELITAQGGLVDALKQHNDALVDRLDAYGKRLVVLDVRLDLLARASASSEKP